MNNVNEKFKLLMLATFLLPQSAAAGTIFSDRSDVGNWSLWTHYAGGEDADVT